MAEKKDTKKQPESEEYLEIQQPQAPPQPQPQAPQQPYPFSNLNVPLPPPPAPMPPSQAPQYPLPMPPQPNQGPTGALPGFPGHPPKQQQPILSPQAKQNAAEMITKAVAANEVMMELATIKQMAVVSLVMVLLVAGVWSLDAIYGTVAALGYVIYAAYRLLRVMQKTKYLQFTYGV